MAEMKLWVDPMDQGPSKARKKAAKVVKEKVEDTRPILADKVYAEFAQVKDCVCECGSDIFDVDGVGRKKLSWDRPFQDCMRLCCCFCGTAQWTVLDESLMPEKTPGEFVLLTGSYSGRTLQQVWDSGESGKRYIRWAAEEHKNTFIRTKSKEFLDDTCGNPGICGTGEGISAGGDNPPRGGKCTRRVCDNREEASRLLGASKIGAPAEWTVVGRVGPDPRGDRGSVCGDPEGLE